jgi:hypothetical protein
MSIASILSDPSDRMLRLTLKTNALFSGAGGIVAAVFAGPLSRLITPATEAAPGISVATVLMVVGIGLVLFAAGVAWVASRDPMPRGLVSAIFWADVAWVLGTVVLVAAGHSWFTMTGLVIVIVVALAVADFAIFEYLGLRRLRAA